MDSRSWLLLEPDPPEHRLPDDLRARDGLGGRDCGWVAQMRPFVRHFSRPGETVFDPFCGFATTLLAAALEDRRGCGVEIDPERAALGRERLARHGVDAPIATGSLPDTPAPRAYSLCLTNVPYFGCRWPGRDEAGQLYLERDYAAYLQRVRDIFHAVREALPQGGYCIAMAENLIVGDRMLPLAWDLGRVLGNLFVAREERLLCYARPPQPRAPGDPRSDRSHEYALVFQKQPETICLQSTCDELDAMRAAGFGYTLHGSFAHWLAHGEEALKRPPADADLLLDDGDPEALDRLLHWLHERHYELSLWGEPVRPPLRLERWAEHWYLRAQRRDRLGRLVRLDLGLASRHAQLPPVPLQRDG
ncbi:DNA methyltransferase [Lysobacter firmicutimachus]|uniref:Methyltransferase n=1 Tax=Lysobacter firmicutimachus TaxID=1792846 RepID=A0AAU8MMA3_9GAMM